jgi:hypothetical protein
MLKIYYKKNNLPFNGTVIDLETVGNFCDYSDSRCYQKLKLTIFGYINNDELKIFCAEGKEAISELKDQILRMIHSLEKPFFAYNCCFEMGVFYHSCGFKLEFDGDLMKEKVAGVKWENKREACAKLGVSSYGDTFNGYGRKCSSAWLNGNYEDAIKHNRSCLLSERDILLKRGYRKPDPFIFHPI